MEAELRVLMETWLQTNGGNFHTCDEERFYQFVLEVAKRDVIIEQNSYDEIVDSCRAHNANLSDEYLSRHNFTHFESCLEFCKYIIRSV